MYDWGIKNYTVVYMATYKKKCTNRAIENRKQHYLELTQKLGNKTC